MDCEDGLLKTGAAGVAGVASSKGAAFGLANPLHNHRITLWNLIHYGLSNLLRRVDPRQRAARPLYTNYLHSSTLRMFQSPVLACVKCLERQQRWQCGIHY